MAVTEKFSGADWLNSHFDYFHSKKPKCISPLGVEAANILGQVFRGIYHIQSSVDPRRVDWGNEYFIRVVVCTELATFDMAELTILVLLAHKRKIRIGVSGASKNAIAITFHKKPKHPSIEQSINLFAPWVDVDFD